MKTKNLLHLQQGMILIELILIGILGRYVFVGFGVQPFPNFEIIMVITFLAVMILRSPLALLVPLGSMIGSDLLIGNSIFVGSQMNRIVLFTYSGFALIALLNIFNRDRLWKRFGELRLKTIGLAAGLGVGFVLIYDVWTNIGWWYLLYPHDAASLAAVFAAGLPFMLYHMISGAVTFVAIAVPVLMYVSQKTTIRQLHPIKLKTLQKIPVVLVVLGLVALSFTGTAMTVPQKSEIWLEKADATSVRLIIYGDGWILKDTLVAYPGDTAFSLLERSSATTGFSLDYTYYEQFDATLVTAINNAVGGTEGKYWQYYVNGEAPMIGADNYAMSNGALLEWRFEVPPF